MQNNALNTSRTLLINPHQLFQPPSSTPQRPPLNPNPGPVTSPPGHFNRVSRLLDHLNLQPAARPLPQGQAPGALPFFSTQPTTSVRPFAPLSSAAPSRAVGAVQTTPRPQARPVLHGLPPHIGTAALKGRTSTNTERQRIMVESGLQEWRSGVRESGGSNRGPRIDTYAKNAKFGNGYEWCGFFTAFNYSKAGFKTPEHFASYQKARDFFLYRSYTSRDSGLHAQLDQQRASDTAAGSPRQYFAMAESNVFEYIDAYSRYYEHIDPNALKHTWQNIPIQPGDVALFNHGHVGMVVSYDNRSGKLVTVEGNTSGEGPDGKQWSQAVVRKTYDLSKASDRKRFDGFGRAADSDFA
jgi:hypothetical protein